MSTILPHIAGLSEAAANYACAWCKIHKNDRWKMGKHYYTDFSSKPLAKSLQEIKEMSKPLLNIDLDHTIVDELHLLLRITDISTSNLTTEAIEWDVEGNKEVKSKQQSHLNMLINSIRSCGVFFDVWKKNKS